MRSLPLIAFLAAGLIGLPVRAQNSRPADQHGAYRIAGTVVSSVDGHLLQRATVELLGDDSARTAVDTTSSDEYGRFAFTGVSSGSHVLRGKARNYLATEYDQHEGFTTAIVTGAGVDTESLVLKLIPQAIISGTIRDEVGDPVPNAVVRLFRQPSGTGDDRLEAAGFTQTDDRGRFEFPRLEPGSYYLIVMAKPWYATYPPPDQPVRAFVNGTNIRIVQPGINTGIVTLIDPSLEVAYRAEFYPGTTDPAAAAQIHLRGGDSLDLSFSLSPVQAVTLTVPVAKGKSPEQQLMLSFHGQSLPVNTEERQSDGQTMLTGLAPGDYRLYQPTGTGPFSPGTPVHITDSTTFDDQLPASGHLHAVVNSSDGSPLPAQPELALVRADSSGALPAFVSPKDEISVDAPPGDYIMQVANRSRPLYIRQIASSAKRLPGNEVQIASNQTTELTITVGVADHVLNGFARSNGKPFAGAFVLMLPFDQSILHSAVARDQTNLDGSFQLSNLAPGTYTLLAIDDGWDVEWRKPDVLAHYLANAITVHIADSAEKTQTLREPVPVQPR